VATRETVLVTGASGYIGSRLVPALCALGYDVRALTNQRPIPAELDQCVTSTVAPLDSATDLSAALVGVDAVCHLAAYIPESDTDPSEAARCLEVNAVGTLRLLEACGMSKVRYMLYASTAAVYSTSVGPVSETSPTYPAERATYYAGSKLLGELFLEHARLSGRIAGSILRLGSVYGPQAPGVLSTLTTRAAAQLPIVIEHGGTPSADFVSVDDVIYCIEQALRLRSEGLYNVGSGVTTSLTEIADHLTSRGYSPIHLEPGGRRSPSIFPALSIARAQDDWQFRPTAVRDGLDQLLSLSNESS
jgi:UDP-glucose 4-epimerase